jgi:CBS domain-containing protein
MDTAAISYRVADFLKTHPPFRGMEEQDLVELAQHGRVKFFEPHQYILTQGSSRTNVLVIQQGTVLLWDERGTEAKLLDVRGTGDMLGIDQLNDVRSYSYSARSASDVLLYIFPTEQFEALIQQYPEARQYVSAYGSIKPEDASARHRREPQNIFLHELFLGKKLPSCDIQTNIRDAARLMLNTGAEAIVVLDSQQHAHGILTARSFLEWIVRSEGDLQKPVSTLDGPVLTMAAEVSVADAILSMNAANAPAAAITSDGTIDSHVQAIVTPGNLGQSFGDRPLEILQEISHARDIYSLRQLNQRARSLIHHYLTNAGASDWLALFSSNIDTKIIRRIIAMTGADEIKACWCFCGAAGRGESVTRLAPQIVMIVDDSQDQSRWLPASQDVLELLNECGYLPNPDRPFETLFYSARATEWKSRYAEWLSDPILKGIYRARPLLDLRPISGDESLLREIEANVSGAINPEVLYVIANDCLATLPPLTFFRDAVVDETGEEAAVFRLKESVLRPLVDVGRVFGMAAKKVFGTSTLERFAIARELLPQHASIFQEASEALRVVLWQQGRVGISQGTAGFELQPASLDPYDRQILRGCFSSILRLLEFTGDLKWLKSL